MGRPKGAPNRLSSIVKQNIIDVFDLIGGTEGMVKWAKRNKTQFYKLYARLLPTEVIGTLKVRDASEFSDDELAAIIAGASRAGITGEATILQIPEDVHSISELRFHSSETPQITN